MPKNIPSWSTCVPQDPDDRSIGQSLEEYLVPNFTGDVVGLGLSVVVFGFLAGAVPALALVQFVEKVMHKVVDGGCVTGTILLGAVLYLCITLALWFDHRRTLCMDTAACAVGTIVHDPHSNGNGDLDLDIAVAPFSTAEQHDAVLAALKSQQGTTPSSGSVNTYLALAGLSATDRLDVYRHAVDDHLLKAAPDRLFQEKYFVSTPYLDSLIKRDEVKAPLYRCPSDDEDPSEKLPIPTPINDAVLQNTFIYLPCVIEGHVVVEWLHNLRNALIAALVGFVAGCALCIYFTGDEHNCAWIGAVVAAILAFLAWLASHLLNDPNDARASGGSGADPVGTPGGTLTTSAERGDVIVAFGSWVTYMQGNQYYEIHPVHAWYLVCRGERLFEKGTIAPEACRFDTSRMVRKDYDVICRMVHAAETADPAGTHTQSVEGGLAMAGGLR